MNIEEYFLTIIIRTYNSASTISKCLHSLINQTRNDIIQILIIDDCSIDNTIFICEKIKQQYNNIRIDIVKHNERYGRGKGLNTAKDYIIGKYCCILDSDDFYNYNNYVENIFNELYDTDIDYLYNGIDDSLHVYFVYLSKHFKKCPILNVNYFEDQYTRWFVVNKKFKKHVYKMNNFYYRTINPIHATSEYRHEFNFDINLFILFKLIFYNIKVKSISESFLNDYHTGISKYHLLELYKNINKSSLSKPLLESYDLVEKELIKMKIITVV